MQVQCCGRALSSFCLLCSTCIECVPVKDTIIVIIQESQVDPKSTQGMCNNDADSGKEAPHV